MTIASINPTTGETLQVFEPWGAAAVEAALARAAAARAGWAAAGFEARAAPWRRAAAALRAERDRHAGLIALEMGKAIGEARAEIDKCVWGCEYFADHAAAMLAPEPAASDAGASYVAFQPLGTVLAVMPWNFPYWQVFRFAAPTLMAGNTALLKHSSNVPQCAQAIERVFVQAGFPDGVFVNLPITGAQAEKLIADPRIHAVTLTGSEAAGRRVAAAAGAALKKTVLELGGSDPFVVLEDADLDAAAAIGVASRYLNAGQSCIAAKRFILVEAIAGEFIARFRQRAEALAMGDPRQEATRIGPLARADLRDELHAQVRDALDHGARAVFGCAPAPGPGWFYPPSLLDGVTPAMRAWREELFGPVAVVVRARDETEALRLANDSRYGLGGSVWTRDPARGERFALALECGAAFVNGLVKSDPRLPFGGIKASGYGRELALLGIREFVNAKTVWIR